MTFDATPDKTFFFKGLEAHLGIELINNVFPWMSFV